MKTAVGRVVTLVAMVVAFALVFARGAAADTFFDSSPGALTSSHAAFDAKDRCNDGHIGDSKELSNDKCLNCHDHEDLKGRIAAGKGFHASPGVKGKKCESCHHEHKGRNYD